MSRQDANAQFALTSFLYGGNATYIENLQARYEKDPTSIDGQWQAFAVDVDWRMAPAGVLILFAVWVLAALALLCSTRLDLIATLAVCTGFFLLGLMSDYLFEERAANGSWWASVAYAVVPNWQLMWVADALEEGKRIPWAYLGTASGYMLAYVGAVLAAALYWFEDRELN